MNRYLTKIAEARKCLTPGAIYNTKWEDGKTMTLRVELPKDVTVYTKDAKKLEQALHHSTEKVLARLFK